MFAKEKGVDYMDLHGRELVDIAICLINSYLFCAHASGKNDLQTAVAPSKDGTAEQISMKKRKELVARRYISKNRPVIKSLAEMVLSGDTSTFQQYEALIGPVPKE